MGRKRRKNPKHYTLSEFNRKLLMDVRIYALSKDLYIWQAFEELVEKGLRYDAEHELRTKQDKTLAKTTRFFAGILYRAKQKSEAKRTTDKQS